MGLLDEARAAQGAKRRGGCGVSRTLDAMSKEDAAELQAVLDDPDIDAPTIRDLLARHGYTASQTAIQTHRRGACCRG